jgi:hypothetical protein
MHFFNVIPWAHLLILLLYISIFNNLLVLCHRWLHVWTCGDQRMVSEWEIFKSNDQRTTYRHETQHKHQLEDKDLPVLVWRKCSMIIIVKYNMCSLCSIYDLQCLEINVALCKTRIRQKSTSLLPNTVGLSKGEVFHVCLQRLTESDHDYISTQIHYVCYTDTNTCIVIEQECKCCFQEACFYNAGYIWK